MPGLDQITIKGFKSIKDLTDFKLGKLNVLIGANGAGKSNFISFFKLLRELVERRLQHYVVKQGGAHALLHYGVKVTRSLTAELRFETGTYRTVLEPKADGGLSLASETGDWGDGFAFIHDAGNLESRLAGFLKGDVNYEAVQPVLATLRSCQVYHFHDTSETAGIKLPGQVNDNLFLRPDASNLAAFLRVLKINAPARYERIRETIQLAAPFFDDFLLLPARDNTDSIQLEWRQKGSDYPFLAHQLSDGTLRLMALTVLLLQPTPPPMIILDEPELGLHPVAVELLAALLHEASDHTQLIVSTQSPALIDHFDPEHVVVVDRIDGASRFQRLEAEPLRGWLEDYSLGELVRKDIIECGPRHE